MSKGMGRVERDVLTILNLNDPIETKEIAALVFNPDGPDENGAWSLTDSQYTSVRRALLSLRRKELAFRLYRNRTGSQVWASKEKAIPHAIKYAALFRDMNYGGSDIQRLLEIQAEG